MVQIANQRFRCEASGSAGIKMRHAHAKIIHVIPAHMGAITPLGKARDETSFRQ